MTVLALGTVLVVVGYALLTPGDGMPGGAKRRIAKSNPIPGGRSQSITPGHFTTTPVPDRSAFVGWRRRAAEIVVGLGLMALGLWCVSLGWPDGL